MRMMVIKIVSSNMGLDARELVLGVCDHAKLKPTCSATETSQNLELLRAESVGIKLSRERIERRWSDYWYPAYKEFM